MLIFLYLNDEDGSPYITTCPVDKLIKRGLGYYSSCGADWWSIVKIKSEKFYGIEKVLSTIDFDSIPAPVGHEIIELKFKPLEYTIINDD